MKTLVAVALSALIAVSMTPALSLAQSDQALLDNQDVQAARENQDVQSPRENQDEQAPRAGTMSRGASNQAPEAVSPASSVSR